MDHRLLVVGLLSCLVAGACQAQSAVAKRVLKADGEGLAERVVGGSFEEAGPAETPAAAWSFWEKGYTRDATTARTAKASAKCVSDDAAVEHGAGQTIILNQTDPLPIVAGGWSKAEGVSGSPDSGYSLYLDLIYTDGTPLWGQINAFDTGSHDWQYREVVVVPEKPVKELRTLGLFRGHTGTVWFDDFSVKEVTLPEGAGLFDGVPVSAGAAPGSAAGERFRLNVGGRPVGELDGTTGALVADGAVGGFLLRDVAANSDFLRPTCTVTVEGATTAKLDGACPELGLRLQATLTLEDGMLRVRGEVADLRGEDRAVAVYFVLPGDFRGGELGLDVRHTAPIGEASTYGSFVGIGAGTNGKMSRYPIAPVVKGSEALCLATPLDEPRVSRLAYDAASRELYAAFDLGLSPATAKFPPRRDIKTPRPVRRGSK